MSITLESPSISARSSFLRRRFAWTNAAVLAASVYFYLCSAIRHFPYTVDDCFIPMRYALNFLHGHGWVFNIGEHVEGCTSPVGLMVDTALLQFLSPDNTLVAMKFVGIVCGLAILYQSYRIAQDLFEDRPWLATASAFLLALSPSFGWSMVNGLETCFAALFLVSAAQRVVVMGAFDEVGAGLFGLAALTRPEFSIMYPGLVVFSLLDGHKINWKAIALYIAPIAAWEIFRLAFYHDWLPNTYYAKHQPFSAAYIMGTQYISDHLSLPVLSFLTTPCLIAGLATLYKRGKDRYTLPIIIGCQMAFFFISGGDWMADGRFLAVILPFLCILWATGAFYWCPEFSLWARRHRVRAVAIGVAFGSSVLIGTLRHYSALELWQRTPAVSISAVSVADMQPSVGLQRWDDHQNHPFEAAAWVSYHSKPGDTVAGEEMGLMPLLLMDRKFIDIFGLCDNHISHIPGYPHSFVGLSFQNIPAADGWSSPTSALGRYILSRHPVCCIMLARFNGFPPTNPHWHFAKPDPYLARWTYQ